MKNKYGPTNLACKISVKDAPSIGDWDRVIKSFT